MNLRHILIQFLCLLIKTVTGNNRPTLSNILRPNCREACTTVPCQRHRDSICFPSFTKKKTKAMNMMKALTSQKNKIALIKRIDPLRFIILKYSRVPLRKSYPRELTSRRLNQCRIRNKQYKKTKKFQNQRKNNWKNSKEHRGKKRRRERGRSSKKSKRKKSLDQS